MCLPDFSFPPTRSSVYKPALRILTQITLPTPAGMKTKPGKEPPVDFSRPPRRRLPPGSGCPPRSFIPLSFTPASRQELSHWQMGCVGPDQHALVSGAESHPAAVPASDLEWPGAHTIHGNTELPVDTNWHQKAMCCRTYFIKRNSEECHHPIPPWIRIECSILQHMHSCEGFCPTVWVNNKKSSGSDSFKMFDNKLNTIIILFDLGLKGTLKMGEEK